MTFANFPHQAAVIHNCPTPRNHPCTSQNPLHPIKKKLITLRHVGMDVCSEGHDSHTGISLNHLVDCWYKWYQVLNVDSVSVMDQISQEIEKLTCIPDWWSWQLEAAAHIMPWLTWNPFMCFLSPSPPFAQITIIQTDWRRGINENHAERKHHLLRIKGAHGC